MTDPLRAAPLDGTAEPPRPTVRVRGVDHAFDEPVLFDNHLDLMPGELVVMTGKSGSGKTTLLTLIGGLRRVQAGSIEVLGRELRGMSERELVAVRRGIGFIFQAHNLFGSLTVYQNVRLALELDGMPSGEIHRRAHEILDQLGLKREEIPRPPQLTGRQNKPVALADALPHQLSGGQRQRVAIARALANRPKLVLADEPTAALDEANGKNVMDLFREVATRQGSTILIVTHDEKILGHTDRLVRMKYGRIVFNVDVKEYTRICRFLRQNENFSMLSPDTVAEVAGKMRKEKYRRGDVIIRQGEIGETLYLIERGAVEVLIDRGDGNQPVRVLEEGDFFGEIAIVRDQPRSATVVAQEDVELYALDKTDFKAAVKENANFEQLVRNIIFQRL